MLADEVRL
jgi:predicted RNA methylase